MWLTVVIASSDRMQILVHFCLCQMVLRHYLSFVSSEAAPVGADSTALTVRILGLTFTKAGSVNPFCEDIVSTGFVPVNEEYIH